jgi:hypothetical protein
MGRLTPREQLSVKRKFVNFQEAADLPLMMAPLTTREQLSVKRKFVNFLGSCRFAGGVPLGIAIH